MFTETEAKTKWCPFARAKVGHAGVNRPLYEHVVGTVVLGEISSCIASNCMAWRWASNADAISASGHGYCGLAGRPT